MLIHGFLNIDKPAGMTSHDVVAKIRRLVGQKRVGHGGTLDPAATGVLPLALGEATRLISYLVDERKSYRATVELGRSTTTDDAEGATVEERRVPPLSSDDLLRALQPFVGTILQTPPMYSAIQVAGQRMYDLARQGQAVDLEPREIEIERIDIVEWQSPLLTLDIRCGKGAYIRAIARDLGAALGCGAHLAALRRTQVGPLDVAEAAPLAALLEDRARLDAYLLPPDLAVAGWPRADLDESKTKRIRNGLPLVLRGFAEREGGLVRAHGPDGRLLALLRFEAGLWKPFRVFGWI
jgi:tRNA pseudouridine55 synthase